MKIDTDALASPGASMQGQMIALTGTKRVADFSLKIELSPPPTRWTAMTWVLSVFIPALIAFLATQLATTLGARRKENDEFRAYRFGQMQQISEFIENDLHPIIGDTKIGNRGRLIFDLLQGKKEMLSKIPERRVNKLLRACITNDVQRITITLKRLYPEATQSLDVEGTRWSVANLCRIMPRTR
jgi:hypothetical protein